MDQVHPVDCQCQECKAHRAMLRDALHNVYGKPENVSRETLDQRSYLDGLTLGPMGMFLAHLPGIDLNTLADDIDLSNSGDLDRSYTDE